MAGSLASSDIWLLLSIIVSGGGKETSIGGIVTAGDMINHAVFTHDELKYGLARLLDQYLIAQSSNGFAPTEYAFSEAQKARSKAKDIFETWRMLEDFFGVMKGDDPPNERALPGYSEEEVALAINANRSEALGVISGLLQKTHGITEEEAERLIDETVKKLQR